MFWDNFELLCRQNGVTPNAVAAAVGIKSSGTVTGWKKGALPRPSIAKKLADYFNVTTQYLLFGEETVSENKEALSLPAEGNEERAWAKQVIDRMDAADFEPIAALLKHYADKYKTP